MPQPEHLAKTKLIATFQLEKGAKLKANDISTHNYVIKKNRPKAGEHLKCIFCEMEQKTVWDHIMES